MGFIDMFNNPLQNFKNAWTELGNAGSQIKEGLTNEQEKGKGFLSSLFGALGDVFDAGIEVLKGAVKIVIGVPVAIISGAVSGGFDGIKSSVGRLFGGKPETPEVQNSSETQTDDQSTIDSPPMASTDKQVVARAGEIKETTLTDSSVPPTITGDKTEIQQTIETIQPDKTLDLSQYGLKEKENTYEAIEEYLAKETIVKDKKMELLLKELSEEDLKELVARNSNNQKISALIDEAIKIKKQAKELIEAQTENKEKIITGMNLDVQGLNYLKISLDEHLEKADDASKNAVTESITFLDDQQKKGEVVQ